MDADIRYITIVCLVGIFCLAAVFGLAAIGDAPQRKHWHQLASRVGLKAETFGTTRLSGYSQSRFVSIEFYLTPPRNYWDVEEGILWTRMVMTVKNAQSLTFIFGRSSVLNHIGGWFEKKLENATTLTIGDDSSPQSFFVMESRTSLVQSLLLQSGRTVQVLLATDQAYFIELVGPRLSYTELGTDLMDRNDVEKSARQIKYALGLLNEIVDASKRAYQRQ